MAVCKTSALPFSGTSLFTLAIRLSGCSTAPFGGRLAMSCPRCPRACKPSSCTGIWRHRCKYPTRSPSVQQAVFRLPLGPWRGGAGSSAACSPGELVHGRRWQASDPVWRTVAPKGGGVDQVTAVIFAGIDNLQPSQHVICACPGHKRSPCRASLCCSREAS